MSRPGDARTFDRDSGLHGDQTLQPRDHHDHDRPVLLRSDNDDNDNDSGNDDPGDHVNTSTSDNVALVPGNGRSRATPEPPAVADSRKRIRVGDYVDAIRRVDWRSIESIHNFELNTMQYRFAQIFDPVPLGFYNGASYALLPNLAEFEVEWNSSPTVRRHPYLFELRTKDQQCVAQLLPLGRLFYSPSVPSFFHSNELLSTSWYVVVDVSGPTPTICVVSYAMADDYSGYILTLPPGSGPPVDDFDVPLWGVQPPWHGLPPFTFAPLMSLYDLGCDPDRVLLDQSTIHLAQDIRATTFYVPR